MRSLQLTVANLIAPDSVFAKGSTSYGSRSGDGLSWGFGGMIMTTIGVIWLCNLNADSDSK